MRKILVLFISLFLCFSVFPQENALGNLIQTLESNYESAEKKGNVKSQEKLTEEERLSILNEVAYYSMLRSYKELTENRYELTAEERDTLFKGSFKEVYLTNINEKVYFHLSETSSGDIYVYLSMPRNDNPNIWIIKYTNVVSKKTDGVLKNENGDVVSAYITLETNDSYVGVFPPLRFIIVQDVVDAEKFTITLEEI
jgi:hypothetical protein